MFATQWKDINLQMIPVDRIEVNPLNPRQAVSEDAMKRLIGSLRKHGLDEPLAVYERPGGRFRLFGGERRLYALKHAGWTNAPCIVKPPPEDKGDELLTVIDDNDFREDFAPVDLAMAYRQLMKLQSWEDVDLARERGLAVESIRRYLRLLDLDPKVQKVVNERRVSVNAVSKLSDQPPAEQRAQVEALLASEIKPGQVGKNGQAGAGRKVRLGPSRRAVFKTDQIYTIEGGTSVSVRSLTRRLSKDDIVAALRAAIKEAQA